MIGSIFMTMLSADFQMSWFFSFVLSIKPTKVYYNLWGVYQEDVWLWYFKDLAPTFALFSQCPSGEEQSVKVKTF